MKKYYNLQYEEQMFYHNSISRNSHFPSIIGELDIEKDGLDNCYDCIRFISIVTNYLYVTDNIKDKNNISGEEKDLLLLNIKNIQNEIMEKTNIKKKTIESLNRYLLFLYSSSFKDCKKNKCKFCQLKKGDIFNKRSTSVATNENLYKIIGNT
jgi:hypothetical protein